MEDKLKITDFTEEFIRYDYHTDEDGNRYRAPTTVVKFRKVRNANSIMRTLNFVIDTITLVSIILLLWWGYLKLVPDNRVNDELNIILQLLAILAISGIYYTFLEYKYQRTVGKWITNTIVFNEYCERPSLKQIIRRTFLRAWSIFFLRFNLLYYLNDEGHCREYHDRSSNTWVVSMKEYREIKELLHEQNINEDNV